MNAFKYTNALAVLILLAACGGDPSTSEVSSSAGGNSSSGGSSSSSTCNSASFIGTKQMGAPGKVAKGESVAIDASCNIYVAGSTTGGLDNNMVAGTWDFFLTKYDSSGVKQYTQQLGAAGKQTYGRSVKTDASGNVYVTGYTNTGLDGSTLIGTQDMFLIKYNSAGVKQYIEHLGAATKATAGHSVAIDANGNVYVTGYTTGGLDGNTVTGTADVFLTKYNSSGVRQYTRQLGVASQNTYGNGVATDASGNVYVTGYTLGGLDGNALTGTRDAFLAKYDNNGVKQYTKQFGLDRSLTYATSVATDATGNAYITGVTWGGLDGNPNPGSRNFFLTKYDSSGAKQYTKQMNQIISEGLSVATDASGNVYVAGYTDAGLDGNTLTGSEDLFLIKYNSAGVNQYTRLLGVASKFTGAYAVATDASGSVFLAGQTRGGLDGNNLTGTVDFFVTRYSGSGVKQ